MHAGDAALLMIARFFRLFAVRPVEGGGVLVHDRERLV